jgi:hypothetical protein
MAEHGPNDAEGQTMAARPAGDAAKGRRIGASDTLLCVVGRYVRAAPLPHASAVASCGAAIVLGELARDAFGLGHSFLGWVLAAMSACWTGATGLCQADALSRYREYRRVKAILNRRGFWPRTLRAMSGSRCRRDAALLAAREAGYGRLAARYYHGLGYRRRPVVAARGAARPLLLLNRRFLRSTFVPGKKAPPVSGMMWKSGFFRTDAVSGK